MTAVTPAKQVHAIDHFFQRQPSIMSRTLRVADSAGVIGAILAALCCAGAPIILSVLAALGLGFLRSDAILLPFMGVALIVALWGFWSDARTHRDYGPLILAIVGAVSLVAGIVFVHGMPAKVLIGVGAIALVVATLWNARCRAACVTRANQGAAAAR